MRSNRFVTPRGSLAPPDRFSVCRSPGLLQGFQREQSQAVRRQSLHVVRDMDFVTSLARIRPETTAQANDSERRVASVSREIASKAPGIAAGGRDRETCGCPPTDRDRSDFPRRLACSRRSSLWPSRSNVTKSGKSNQPGRSRFRDLSSPQPQYRLSRSSCMSSCRPFTCSLSNT